MVRVDFEDEFVDELVEDGERQSAEACHSFSWGTFALRRFFSQTR
jgi:hypothetical protein